MSGETIECVEHKWHFPPNEVCPVCEGIELEQSRIVKLLEDRIITANALSPDGLTQWDNTFNLMIQHTIELIKEETNEPNTGKPNAAR